MTTENTSFGSSLRSPITFSSTVVLVAVIHRGIAWRVGEDAIIGAPGLIAELR